MSIIFMLIVSISFLVVGISDIFEIKKIKKKEEMLREKNY